MYSDVYLSRWLVSFLVRFLFIFSFFFFIAPSAKTDSLDCILQKHVVFALKLRVVYKIWNVYYVVEVDVCIIFNNIVDFSHQRQ